MGWSLSIAMSAGIDGMPHPSFSSASEKHVSYLWIALNKKQYLKMWWLIIVSLWHFWNLGCFFLPPFPFQRLRWEAETRHQLEMLLFNRSYSPMCGIYMRIPPAKKKHVKSHSTYLWTRFVWRSFEDQIFHETQHPAIGVPHDLGNLQRHPEESAQLLWCPSCSKLAADRTTTRTPSAMATILDACSQGGRTGGTSTKCCGL